MATTERGWLPVATGVMTTALAIWLVVNVVSSNAEPQAAADPTTAPVVTVAEPPVTAPPPEPVVISTPPPELAGLTESISRVLSTSGFAYELTVDDIASELPATVYRTLVDQGAVLSIATEEAGQ